MAMGKFLGLVLLMSGIAMAALWLPSGDGSRQLAQVVHISDRGIARVASPGAPDTGRPEPSSAPSRPAAAAVQASAQKSASAPSLPRGSSKVVTGPSRVTSEVVVTNASADTDPLARLDSPQPANGEAYYALVRDLQRELRRLGCYWGEVDGSWGPGTRRAMSTLMGRVNATLPVNEPDYILLALARSQTDQTCRKPCTADEHFVSDTGQCQPRALLRHAAANHSADIAPGAIPGQDTGPPSAPGPIPGQMSIGGPRTDGPDVLAAPIQRPRSVPSWYSQPRRDNSWKRKVFGDFYGR
jgi:hypothetical protein